MTDSFIYPQPFWQVVENEHYPTLNMLSKKIRENAENGFIQLPNLRKCQNICIGSDYSGEHAQAKYQVLGFVIANRDTANVWQANIQEVRKKYLRDNRSMAYKKLDDKVRQKALRPYFEASDSLEGICVVIAIHNLCILFDKTPMRGAWESNNAFVKALRIANLFSLFLGGLTKPNQHILWITDQDNIIATYEQGRDFAEMVDILKTAYMPHKLKGIDIATTASNDPKTMELEDLTAIPDLLGGACFWLYSHQYQNDPYNLFQPTGKITNKASAKVNAILQWAANNDVPLKKLVFTITPNPTTNECEIQSMRYSVR